MSHALSELPPALVAAFLDSLPARTEFDAFELGTAILPGLVVLLVLGDAIRAADRLRCPEHHPGERRAPLSIVTQTRVPELARFHPPVPVSQRA